MRTRLLFVIFCFLSSFSLADKPKLILANNYHPSIQLDDYLVSEKYDGVRAFWNGKQLISRQGFIFSAPAYFTQHFPAVALDGELWLARGEFDHLSAIVRSSKPSQEWKNIRYMVFDAPDHKGKFQERYEYLQALLSKDNMYIYAVQQSKISTSRSLFLLLDKTVSEGGEGLMLHNIHSYYHAKRSDDLLKLKPFNDAEATVIAHHPGKGKFHVMMGSLHMRMPNNKEFRLGTGFTLAQRINPPPIGSKLTYRFNGFTKNGLPRFARFIRIRDDWQ